MAITRATGFPQGGGSSLAVTVAAAGDLMLAACWLYPDTARVTGVTSTRVSTWTQATTITDTGSGLWLGLWWGVSTSSGADTIVFTTTGTPTYYGYFADELTTTSPSWAVTVANTSSGDNAAITWPSLTAANSDSAYWGFATIGGGTVTGTNGTPAGFTYWVNGTENIVAFDGTVTSGSYQPKATGSVVTYWDTVALIASAQPATVAGAATLHATAGLSATGTHVTSNKATATLRVTAALRASAGTTTALLTGLVEASGTVTTTVTAASVIPSPIISIRERPPLRLTVNVTTPGGFNARWGADDPDPANQPQDLTFGTQMPGGFTDLTCTLQRDPRQSYPDVQELSMVTARGVGGEIAWQGRQEALPDTGGSQAQISPQCSGWQNHLDDNSSATMIYVDQTVSTWSDPPLNRQIEQLQAGNALGSNSTASDPSTQLPAIVLEVDGAWTSIPWAEAWYDSGVASPITKVWYSFNPNGNAGASWVASVAIAADDQASSFDATGNLAAGDPTTITGYLDGGGRYALLQFYYDAANAGIDGDTYLTYWKTAVYGNHGLPGQGADPVGFLASDVVAHAVGAWAPRIGFTTGPNGTIQPSSFVINQLTFPTPGTSSTIIKQAVQYEILDWAVWEGPTFWLNPFGQSAKTRNWRARVGECQLEETGPDITSIYNGVLVTYTLPDGTSATVGPPGSGAQTESVSLVDPDPLNPANEAGIKRWYQLQMGTSVPADATQAGAAWLQTQKTLNTSGQASLVGHVQDSTGTWWPAWMMRAGDTLTVLDSNDTSPRRIVSTSYSDSSKTNSIQLDQPPSTTDALLLRMSEAISVLGLS